MFESRTYEALLASALSRVASPVDKREGSMVMNGVALSMAYPLFRLPWVPWW